MRVALTCRDLAVDSCTGSGANTIAAATALAAAGHDVRLVSAELAAPWVDHVASLDRVTWRPLLPERRDHLYFTDELSYADRVYDTLVALHHKAPLDVVEMPDTGGEAFTVLRARRLLGKFPRAILAVSLQPWGSRRVGADEPTHLASEVATYTDRYAASHADVQLSVRSSQDGSPKETTAPRCTLLPGLTGITPLLDEGFARPGPSTDEPPARTILWMGAIRAGAGLDTFLRAVEAILDEVPELRVIIRGEDTPTDPLGRSFKDHIEARLPDALRPVVTFSDGLRVRDVASLPPRGTQCVLASGGLGTPGEAQLAMAAGFVTTAPRSSIGAAVLRDGETGRIVPDDDAGALAAVLIECFRDPARGERLSAAAMRFARAVTSPEALAHRLEAAYRLGRRPRQSRKWRPSPRISAVVPVYNGTEYLAETLDSLRRAGPSDLEIVVVDDGSTDPAVAPLLRGLDDITLVEQRHRGLSAARNAGIERSTGELVLVIDADDLVEPGFLPAAAESLRRCPELGFVSGHVRYFGLLDFVQVPIGAIGPLDLVLHTSLRSMVLFRRECLEAVNGYDEGLAAFEDWEIQIRLALAGYASDVLPLVGQRYRRHATSMSFSTSNAMRGELVQYILRKHAPQLTQPQLVRLLQNVVAFWKDGYEPSRSVLLQRERLVLPPDRAPPRANAGDDMLRMTTDQRMRDS